MPVTPSITRRNLPHWTREGSIYWITFRLADAIPQEKLRVWKEERDVWFESHNEPWSEIVWKEYDERFGCRLEEWLDAGLGSRALARLDVRDAVKECLLRFNGDRLRLHAAVIMPTHIHLLLEPLENNELSDLLKGIKGASARQANKLLGQSGTFWLDESYDHIVRSQEQYRHFLGYIAENPIKAGLHPDEYWLFQGDPDVPVCVSFSKGDTGIPACVSSPESTDKNVCATLESRLRQLLAYADEPHGFNEAQTEKLIDAIDNLKALDPAVGSGAFPMGILHKLVHVLKKLDPDNERWKAKQIAKLDDVVMREEAERVFRDNYDDYGRKLYLIENCIYGVDIQPIAVQIAKMRFFISLIVDQKVDPAKPNLGVRALPNLETKFVAANTLIGIHRPEQMLLRNPAIDKKEAELRQVREKHFNAKTPANKTKWREQDKKLRTEIAEMLKTDGWDDKTARQLAAWDPYDQNASADFFDPEWMFGITKGFNVVIGNPPWGIPMTTEEKTRFRRDYVVAQGILDSYALFIERGDRLLNNRGVLSMILPDIVLLKAYPLTRKYLLDRYVINWAVFWGGAFDAVNLDTCTIIASKENRQDKRSAHLVKAITDVSSLDIRQSAREIPQHVFEKAPDHKFNLFWSKESEALKSRIERHTQPFCELFHSHEGIHSGNIRDKLFVSNKRGKSCRPLIFGRDEIKPFGLVWAGRYVRYTENIINKAKGDYANLAKEAYFTQPKLFVRRTGDFVMAAVDRKQYFASNNLFVCVPRTACDLDYLAALLNSRLMTWYFRCIQPRVGRIFAELKIVHLNTFPIRAADGALQNQLASLAKKLKASAENGIAGDTAVLREELNTLVYQAYELDRKDVEQIEKATE